jgi:hypothetical protein
MSFNLGWVLSVFKEKSDCFKKQKQNWFTQYLYFASFICFYLKCIDIWSHLWKDGCDVTSSWSLKKWPTIMQTRPNLKQWNERRKTKCANNVEEPSS